MSRAIATMGAGAHEPLLRLALRTIRPYAERHGYDLHAATEPVDGSRPAPWSKIVTLRELAGRYDLLVWLDSDLTVVDPSRDIAADLPDGALHALVEHHVPDGRLPNTGVWVLRGGDETVAFLDEVWAQEQFVEHRWWENAAVCHLLGYELDPPRRVRETAWLKRTAWLDGRWNSTHDAPSQRPFIRHYPGYKVRTRRAFMLRDLALRAVTRR